MTIQEKLAILREKMKENNMDIYMIPTADFHQSEYVGEYFKARSYMSGFTGSAGTLVVTLTEAGLWTDGRYFIQAEQQLAGSTITLYRMSEEGVPTVKEFVEDKLPQGGVIGFDGRVLSSADGAAYAKIAEKKQGSLSVAKDLVNEIWTDRPQLPTEKVWILTDEYSGETTASKLGRIREVMKEKGAQVHLISSLYDIAWILNLRGNDISHVPVFLSFLMIEEDACTLFIHAETLTDEVRAYLADNDITVCAYDEIYDAAAKLAADKVMLMDEHTINYRIRMAFPEGLKVVDDLNPSERMKAIKNATELKNTRIAHLKDGVAVTKFMYWLKTHVGKEYITEYTAGKYLDSLRAEQENFLDLSFDNISAYGANAAMMHYSAKEETAAELKPEGFLLVDSGGHYYEGTTDITITFVLGPLTDKQKLHFTTV